MGASATPSGSRPSDGAQEVSTLTGFDPSRVKALADLMRRSAKCASEVSRMMAQAKSLRQGHNPPRDDLYSWTRPEQTVEWEVATILYAIAMEARRVSPERGA